MKITVLSVEKEPRGKILTAFVESMQNPKEGVSYTLQKSDFDREGLNNLFHLLVDEYFHSGAYSWTAETMPDLRDCVKVYLGKGFEWVSYIDDNGHIKKCNRKQFDFLPEYIRQDKTRVIGHAYSWAKYSDQERYDTILRLKTQMKMDGVDTQRFNDILDDISRMSYEYEKN